MPGRSSHVSLTQLAEHTGLSVGAVSSVLNGRWKERRIAETSVKRIRAAALKLGYVPNIFARRLSMHTPGTTQALLAVITSFEAPLTLVSNATLALHNAVKKLGPTRTRFTITIETFNGGNLQRLPGLLDNYRFSGAIIANTLEADDRFLTTAKIPYPVVLINRPLPGYAAVLSSPGAGRAAANLLIESGSRNCALLTLAKGSSSTDGRANEYLTAIRAATGRAANEIVCRGMTELDGYRAMCKYLRRHPETDGIFVIRDNLAIGAYHAISESGRSIPKNIRVVGVGDHAASPHLLPPLSTTGSSDEQLHLDAAALLLALFTGRESGAPHRVLPLQVIQRASTGH